MRITNELITAAIAKEPELTYFGFYGPHHHKRVEHATTDYATKLTNKQAELFDYLHEIQICHDWLDQQDIGIRVTHNALSSYGLKHAVEWASQVAGNDRVYVSNGAFLAAVVIAGVPFKRVDLSSLNAYVAVKHNRGNKKFYGVFSVHTGYAEFKPFPENYFQVPA